MKPIKEQFEIYYNFLIQENEKFNLTGITEKNEVYQKHFLDSLAGCDIFEESKRKDKEGLKAPFENLIKSSSTIIDVGAGAGFPSLPLAITRPDCNILMLDSLNKRVNFLNQTTELVGLKNAFALHGRSEDAAQNKVVIKEKINDNFNFLSKFKDNQNKLTMRESFDIATARAVAALPTLLEYLAAFVKIGGKVICYKGENFEDELKLSQNAINKLGLKYVKNVEYSIFDNDKTTIKRNLLIFEKISKTPIQYPRGKNEPRNKPL